MIVAPALVRRGFWPGFWISHIFVDHPASQAGGREIWGLPKELAQFTWETVAEGMHVEARRESTSLAAFDCHPAAWGVLLPFLLPAISRKGSRYLKFLGTGRARLGLVRGRIELPAESPFAALGFGEVPRLLNLKTLNLTAHPPRSI